ncbi:acetyl-CoA carboxylase carboxyl transferase subunit beta [Latilactobacillus sakei]|uniref:acetyl-CoA carboxylase carboxyltransferase subunit beta n=1 Tax=Latilactobacillus sakei TaxID=1599 RepID=UPI00202EBED1|nr:acetyl-CoA carboxylase carboxyltransferase subunit beta [Latilactobacillus sakei]MCM1598915.1 acetyl-CoA carboxylase carboxyl transferase subunit beta [Latilactobacillus sakei]
MQLFNAVRNIGKAHLKYNQEARQKVPDGLWVACPKCQQSIYHKGLGYYRTCPVCQYGFRTRAKVRLDWLVDSFEPAGDLAQTPNPLHFPKYPQKLRKAEQITGLEDSILTGVATIKQQKFALGIMDPYFIMGSMGSATGEKITRLFELATEKGLPVILIAASGGARMQEGIFSLMQMAKTSAAVKQHAEQGLLYISLLTDPTTGGVTASFATEADIILAEPKAVIGFAGRRVIEQTMHEQIAPDLQDAETVLKNGFIDQIVARQDQKKVLHQLLKLHERGAHY